MRISTVLVRTCSCPPTQRRPVESRRNPNPLPRRVLHVRAEAAAKLDEFAAHVRLPRRVGEPAPKRSASGVRRGMKLERLPPACELKPIRHSVRPGDGYTVENVAFESLPGFWVTGNSLPA